MKRTEKQIFINCFLSAHFLDGMFCSHMSEVKMAKLWGWTLYCYCLYPDEVFPDTKSVSAVCFFSRVPNGKSDSPTRVLFEMSTAQIKKNVRNDTLTRLHFNKRC